MLIHSLHKAEQRRLAPRHVYTVIPLKLEYPLPPLG
nr:winged helix-turn-helix transcriptional regulator [Mixta theicola]